VGPLTVAEAETGAEQAGPREEIKVGVESKLGVGAGAAEGEGTVRPMRARLASI
jgi:hypothetical protein